MSVDVGPLKDAIRDLAVEKMQCIADGFVEEARGRAPVRTGELADSIEHTPPADTGASISCDVSVGAPYAIYVERGRGGEHGLLAIQIGGELRVVTSVAPAGAQPFWQPTVDAWSSIVGGCAG